MDYEVVYSAALERQGLGMTLSGARGPSTLVAFATVDSFTYGDIKALELKARKIKFRNPWHVNRSTKPS